MRPHGPLDDPPGDGARPRSPRAASPLDVRGHRRVLGTGSRCRRPSLSSVGADAVALRTSGRFHRGRRRHPGRQRVRLGDGRPTASRSNGDRCRVPIVHVHGTGPSRGRPCHADRPRRDEVGEGARDPDDDAPRIRFRRIGVSSTRIRTHPRDAFSPRFKGASSGSSLQGKVESKAAIGIAQKAHKPSYTTLIYEARNSSSASHDDGV